MQTHLLAIQLYTRKQKPLLVLQALKRGRAIDIAHPTLHTALITFLFNIDRMELNPITKEVIDIERKSSLLLGGGNKLSLLNEQFLSVNGKSLIHRLSVARVIMLLDGDVGKKRALQLVLTIDQSASISACEDVYDFLLNELKEKEVALKYQVECSSRFPLTPSFKIKSDTHQHNDVVNDAL